jgi:hypothetical protein
VTQYALAGELVAPTLLVPAQAERVARRVDVDALAVAGLELVPCRVESEQLAPRFVYVGFVDGQVEVELSRAIGARPTRALDGPAARWKLTNAVSSSRRLTHSSSA